MRSQLLKNLLVLILVLNVPLLSCNYIENLGDSGIEGQVLRGPMCPVVNEQDPCPDQPFSALFHVFGQQQKEVATFRTHEDGKFRVILIPGDYTIVADESAPLHPARQAKNVTVLSGTFTKVTLVFDTGIQ